MNNPDAQLLSHIYWLGGSPCCGKSTIADRIASRHGMTVYRCDDAFYEHVKLVTPETEPVFHKLLNFDTDDLWLRPVDQQISEEMELYREEFHMILDDLCALPSDRPIIAEGAALMPALVAPLLMDPHKMIWMVPTEDFQRTHYGRRKWRHDVLHDCSDPEQGWDNWMARDAGYAREVALQARRTGVRLVTVDGSRSLEENARIVRGHYGLVPS